MPNSRQSLLVPMALASMCLVCGAQEAAPPFSLLLTAKQDTVPAGSEIRFTVVLTNTSDRAIAVFADLGRAAEVEGYLVELLDSRGRTPRTSRYYWSLGRSGRRVPKGSEQDYSGLLDLPGAESFAYVNLNPGASRESRFDVSKLYVGLEPGKYTVQVRRIDRQSKAEAKSNVITIEVTK